MELSGLNGLILGFISGLADILPVSAQAHRILIMKFLGESGESPLARLFIHMATVVALWLCCRGHIIRMTRASNLAKIPKKRRKRPLDKRSLMDMSLLKTSLIPVIVVFFFYNKISFLSENLILVAAFLFVNGVILYIPQFLPGSNKDSAYLTRVEGILLGLGGGASAVPGISAVGTIASIGSVCGMEKMYTLNMALLMNIPVNIALTVHDLIAIVQSGSSIGFGSVFTALLAAAGTFIGVFLGIRLLRKIISSFDMSVFSFYCWGAALFIFILYLTAA